MRIIPNFLTQHASGPQPFFERFRLLRREHLCAVYPAPKGCDTCVEISRFSNGLDPLTFGLHKECHILMDAADRAAAVGTSAGKLNAYQGSMNRLLAGAGAVS